MTEHIGVQRAASYPFDQRPMGQLLSTSQSLGERAFADRADCALRQGSRCHALNIRITAVACGSSWLPRR